MGAGSKRVHSHSTPLHQAALSGSLASVQALVRAGAPLDARDTMWNGTPLGWGSLPADTIKLARLAVARALASVGWF